MKGFVSVVVALMLVLSMFTVNIETFVKAAQNDTPDQIAYSDNFALGKNAVSSANEVNYLTPDLAVDGDRTSRSSRWSSGQNDNQWMYVDLGEAMEFNRVDLYWQTKALRFKLQVSDDAAAWRDIYTEFADKDNEGGNDGVFTNVCTFEPVTARYVRMLGIARTPIGGTKWGYSIYEFEVYNGEPKPTPQSVANSVEVRLNSDQTGLVLPEVGGFEVKLLGSDNDQVISDDGVVTQPLVDMQVNVCVEATDLTTGKSAYSTDKPLVVTGRYPDEGENEKPFVAPALREWHGASGDYAFGDSAKVVLDSAYRETLAPMQQILVEDFTEILGRDVEVVFADKANRGDVFITLSGDAVLGDEGNLIEIDNSVQISAVTYTGAFWGTRSVLQILQLNGGTMPKGVARDYPKYKNRGFMLDVARKFIPMESVEDYMKTMSWYKLNNLQLHLNDNGFLPSGRNKNDPEAWADVYAGFRIECETYPGLTNTDGSYTKDEFRSFMKESNAYGVTIIPEFDAPAHALAFTKYRPDLGSTSHGFDHLDINDPEPVYEFLDALYLEYIGGDDPVFVNKDVHIGTDEWGGNKQQLVDMTKHYLEFMLEHGKRARFWGGFNSYPIPDDHDLPKDALAYMWYTGYGNADTLVQKGYEYLNINDGTFYIVPKAGYYNDYLNNQNIYNNWNATQPGNVPKSHPLLTGAMFACWNDLVGNGVTGYDIQDRVFLPMPVLSQRVWSEDNQVDFGTYRDIVTNQLGDGPNPVIVERPDANEDGVVLDLQFKDGAATDASGMGNNGALNGVTVVDDAQKGSVAQFNGAGSITTGLRAIKYPFTVSMDIKVDADNTNKSYLLSSKPSKYNDLPEGYEFNYLDGALKLMQGDTGNLGFSREYTDFNFGQAAPVGEWCKLTVIGTKDYTALYINDVLVKALDNSNSEPITLNPSTGNQYATFAAPLGIIGENFKGQLANLKVWNTANDPAADDANDLPIEGMTATAGSEHLGAGNEGYAYYVLDNKTNTIWHTDWNGTARENMWVMLDLGGLQEVNGLRYLPRQSGTNGNITKYEIEISADGGQTFTSLATGDWSNNAAWKMAKFDSVQATHVRLKAIASIGNFASAAEIRVMGSEIVSDLLGVTGAPENGYTRSAVTLTAEQEAVWTVNGAEVETASATMQFKDEGTYTVTAKAGDLTSETIVFTIDRTAPVLTASVEHYGITNQDVYFNTDEEVAFYNGSEIISEGAELTLTESGTYNIRAIDKAGNYTAFYRVTIMKDAPVLTGAPEGATRNNVAIRSNVKVLFIVNGVEADDYAYGLKITEEGKYTVKAVDMAGNESEVSFEIDRTKPTFTASVPSGQPTNEDITLTANEQANFVIDGVTVATGTAYTVTESAVVYVYDLAGNYGGVYKANIDKSAPVLSAVIEGTNKAVENGATVTQNVTVKASEASYFIINDEEPTARANFVKLKASGTYTVKAVDMLGNVSEAFTVTISRP